MKKVVSSLKESAGFFLGKKGAITHVFLFLLVLFGAFYLTFSRGAVESLIDQTLERQKVVVEANVSSIEDFLTILGRSLGLLSRDKRITSGRDIKSAMDDFLTNWQQSPVNEIIFANKEGVVEFVSNNSQNDEFGSFVGDRDYFIAAVNLPEGDFYVGKPVKARFGIIEGQYLIPLSIAVYNDQDELQGVLGLNVALNEFVEDYLNKAKITKGAKVYLLDDKGNFLYNEIEEDIGKNIIDFVKEDNFVGSKYVRELVEKTIDSELTSGTFDLVLPESFEYPNSPLKRQLIAYASFDISQNEWLFVEKVPVEDALAFVGPFYARQVVGLFVLSLVFLAVSVRISRMEGFVEGIVKKKKGKKK